MRVSWKSKIAVLLACCALVLGAARPAQDKDEDHAPAAAQGEEKREEGPKQAQDRAAETERDEQGEQDEQAEETSPYWSESDESFLRIYYLPAEDKNAGRLYPKALKLMEMLRTELPEPGEIDLSAPGAGGVEVAEGAGGVEEEDAPGWAVAIGPVVGGEKLAHAQFMAGSYGKAERTYRRLYEKSPKQAHLALMLGLCLRNLGRPGEARRLLRRAAELDPELNSWVGWTEEVSRITSGMEEAVK